MAISPELVGHHPLRLEIMRTWQALARHAEDCGPCLRLVKAVKKEPGAHLEGREDLCDPGRALAGAWDRACHAYVDQLAGC